MIEVTLVLKLDAFLINSMGKSENVSSQMSARALRLSCEKIVSAKLLTEGKPTAEFEFLGSAGGREMQQESDQEFDNTLVAYLKAHTTVDASRVNIARYVAEQKGGDSSEIGRMYLTELPNQRGLDLEVVFSPDEFDAAWELLTQQRIRKVIATLTCFKLMQGAAAGPSGSLLAAGVLSCSLQLAPND